MDGADSIKLFGEEISVRANIQNLAGISGHADREMLLDWLKHTGNPVRIFVNHGDDEVCSSFAKTIEDTLHFKATAPFSGDSFDLATGSWIQQGQGIRVTKRKVVHQRSNQLYDRLIAAVKRLTLLVERSSGLSNKLLSRFTDQINSLCDKYEK